MQFAYSPPGSFVGGDLTLYTAQKIGTHSLTQDQKRVHRVRSLGGIEHQVAQMSVETLHAVQKTGTENIDDNEEQKQEFQMEGTNPEG